MYWTEGKGNDEASDDFADWTDLNLNFFEDSDGVRDITIGFYITNYSNYPVKATVTIQQISNVTIDKLTQVVKLSAFKQDPISKLAKITLSLDNDSIQVKNADLNIIVEFEKYIPVPTTEGWEFVANDMDGTCQVTAYKGNETDVIMPTILSKDGNFYTVTSIAPVDNVFINAFIESFNIADTVTSIGQMFFYKWTSLQEVFIPSSVTSMKKNAFRDCISLKRVTFGGDSRLTTLGKGKFYN